MKNVFLSNSRVFKEDEDAKNGSPSDFLVSLFLHGVISHLLVNFAFPLSGDGSYQTGFACHEDHERKMLILPQPRHTLQED